MDLHRWIRINCFFLFLVYTNYLFIYLYMEMINLECRYIIGGFFIFGNGYQFYRLHSQALTKSFITFKRFYYYFGGLFINYIRLNYKKYP